jgi:hypothetical protein
MFRESTGDALQPVNNKSSIDSFSSSKHGETGHPRSALGQLNPQATAFAPGQKVLSFAKTIL